MKFALVDGQPREAQPQLSGQCRFCGAPMIPKCGEVRVPHWAHKGRLVCDPWLEGETDWHRAWKDKFPTEWQEVIHHADDGERHIADVKTHAGWVIEFQHSYIPPEERRSREFFYSQLLWVVDARGKRAREQIIRCWNEGAVVGPLRQILVGDSELLRKWTGSSAPVLFDLGESDPLAWLFANSGGGPAYLARLSRGEFIERHCNTAPESANAFKKLIADLREVIALYERYRRVQPVITLRHPRPRRHFRF